MCIWVSECVYVYVCVCVCVCVCTLKYVPSLNAEVKVLAVDEICCLLWRYTFIFLEVSHLSCTERPHSAASNACALQSQHRERQFLCFAPRAACLTGLLYTDHASQPAAFSNPTIVESCNEGDCFTKTTNQELYPHSYNSRWKFRREIWQLPSLDTAGNPSIDLPSHVTGLRGHLKSRLEYARYLTSFGKD